MNTAVCLYVELGTMWGVEYVCVRQEYANQRCVLTGSVSAF